MTIYEGMMTTLLIEKALIFTSEISQGGRLVRQPQAYAACDNQVFIKGIRHALY